MFLFVLAVILAVPRAALSQPAASLAGAAMATESAIKIDNLVVRVGPPRIARGPAGDIGDNHFSLVRLPDGQYRGFTANAISNAIDGGQPWAMTGEEVRVLGRGPAGSNATCGNWINHVENEKGTLLAWIHSETACHYENNEETHKSMSFATSKDYGKTWSVLGPILTGTDPPASGKQTGEGDCTALDGNDGYFYAYCGRPRDEATIVARAPVNNPGPGHWTKYYNGAWNEPGLGGNATKLSGGVGATAAYWPAASTTVDIGTLEDKQYALFFSQDRINFTPLRKPLLAVGHGMWKRPDPSELVAYITLFDAQSGGSLLGPRWMLAYTDIQPGETFAKRYLVLQPVEVSRSRQPGEVQVATALSRWYNPALHDHWSTTGVVPGSYSSYKLESEIGYLMTAPDDSRPSVEVEDCVHYSGTHPDHFLAAKGVCEGKGFQRFRTAGWMFTQLQPGTQAVYLCYSNAEASHFAALTSNCDGLGKMESIIGYDVKQ